MVKKAQQLSLDQEKQQAASNPAPTNPNAAPKAPVAEAPKAPVAPTAEAPKAPVAPTATNPNPNPPPKEEADNTDNNTNPVPSTTDNASDLVPNNEVTDNSQKSGTFSGLVGDAISNSLSKKREAYNHFKQQHVKKAILDEMDGKHCVVSFAGSNDMFPAIMNSEAYDDFTNNGMTNMFDIVEDTIKSFSISITTDEEKIMSHIKEIAVDLHQLGFSCVVALRGNTYNMRFSADEEVKTQDVLDVVLKDINEFAKEFEDSTFDASELNKGNLKEVSKFAPSDKLMEL